MKTRPQVETRRPLLVLGRPAIAAELALRRVLHAKEARQPLVIADYQGSLAPLLTKRNKGNLHKGPLLWCELANRRRPIALFQFRQSAGMTPALRTFLRTCANQLATPISESTIELVVGLAYRLADQGSIGLASLVHSLRRPEIANPLRRDQGVAEDLDRLVELIDWMLRFPGVWALSEGNNSVDLGHAITSNGTVWIEMPSTHFERLEHLVMSWMIDAALMAALIAKHDGSDDTNSRKPPPIVLHGFPGICPNALTTATGCAKHVGLFAFSANHPLPITAQAWLDADADCWIAGDIGELPVGGKTNWLDDAEYKRIGSLEPGQVWVRAGVNGKAVTVQARSPEPTDSLAKTYRLLALRHLRHTPVKQFSTALTSAQTPAPQNTDLYRKLCMRDTLYAGWFRVKAHNKRSHGHDQVTIEQFGEKLDAELQSLAEELAEGRYRSRPLRTVRIPKTDGEFRVLRIACVRDRVVQAACLQLLEPLFETRFSNASFAYRPGRSAHHAVAVVRAAIATGKHWAVTADIRKCFDRIDHDILLRLVADVVGDRDLLQLLRHWLTADVIDLMDITPAELGVPQGASISPLLANIYLDPLDKEFEKTGTAFARYADDYMVLCNSDAEAQAALRLMTEFLQGSLHLALKPAKTQYGHVQQGVNFLGFQIGLSDAQIPADKLGKATRIVSELVEAIGSAQCNGMQKWDLITRLNALTKGFRNYYLIDNAPAARAQLTQIDHTVDALAGSAIANDPSLALAWPARERFVPIADAVMPPTEAVAQTLTGGYPLADHVGPTIGSTAIHMDGTLGLTDATATQSTTPLGGNQATSDEDRDPAFLVVDGRLHILRSGCYVTIAGDDVVVRRRKNELFRISIAELTMVYLEGKGIAVSAELTMSLCDKDVPVVFTPLIGIPAAIAQPVQSSRSNVRQQQIIRRNEPDIVSAGLKMLAAKVANQASLLKYFARYQKRKGDSSYDALTRGADEVRSIAETINCLDPVNAASRNVWMGHEGRAAAKYWSTLAQLIPQEYGFPGRHARHASDPVNSAVNYLYGMLYCEVWRAVIRAGLDPYFGIVHGKERDQGSLVFDLIEEYRAPFADRVLLGLLGRGFLLVLDKEGRLTAACRHKLVKAFHKLWHREIRWNTKMRKPSEILELQVTSLKNTYLGTNEYRPFRFRW